MSQLNLFKFFKVTPSSSQVALSSPDGQLSCDVPSTAIAAVNKEVEKIVIEGSTTKKRNCYQKFILKQKALIGNYPLINGTSAVHPHYVGEFPGLKYTTVCDWKKAISAQQQKEHEAGTELHG